jgi:hypothetical protein
VTQWGSNRFDGGEKRETELRLATLLNHPRLLPKPDELASVDAVIWLVPPAERERLAKGAARMG